MELTKVGKLIWWELRNTDKLIPIAEFKKVAEEVGFQLKLKKTTAKAIVSEVCKRLQLTKKSFSYGGKKYVGGFEDKDVSEESLFAKAAILLRLDDQTLICKTEETANEVENLKGKITPYKIMQYIVKWIVDNNGINLRRNGAIYFIPEENCDVIDKISKILESLDIGTLRVIDISPTASTVKSLVSEFLSEVQIRLDDLYRIASRKKTDRAEKFMDRVKNLEKLVNTYQIKFGIKDEEVDQLRRRIKALERRFVKVVG